MTPSSAGVCEVYPGRCIYRVVYPGCIYQEGYYTHHAPPSHTRRVLYPPCSSPIPTGVHLLHLPYPPGYTCCTSHTSGCAYTTGCTSPGVYIPQGVPLRVLYPPGCTSGCYTHLGVPPGVYMPEYASRVCICRGMSLRCVKDGYSRVG